MITANTLASLLFLYSMRGFTPQEHYLLRDKPTKIAVDYSPQGVLLLRRVEWDTKTAQPILYYGHTKGIISRDGLRRVPVNPYAIPRFVFHQHLHRPGPRCHGA